MKIDLSQFRETFMQESAEHLVSMETGLLELRSAPADTELLNAIFRSAHSIKGGAGSFGLNNLVRFTHALENLLDRLRALEMEATGEIIALLLQSVDVLRALLDAGAEGPMPSEAPELMERIEALLSSTGSDEAAGTVAPPAPPSAASRELHAYKVDFQPGSDMFSSGTNPIVLLRNLAELGTVSVCELDTAKLPSLAELDPERCYLGWTVEIATSRPEEELREVFEFVEHLAEITFNRVDGEQPVERGLTLSPATPPAISAAPSVVPVPSPPTPAASAPVASAARPAGMLPPPPPVAKRVAAGGERRKEESSSIRVATEKVDRLIDLVGELVIANVMTAQMVEHFEPAVLPKLREAVAAMERGTRELHERVMAVRMMPVGTLFQRYTRVVYDIAKATGKEIDLDMTGEDTEIDKSMLELLGDPLTHVIRNSADHGIEQPAARIAAGKPAEGTISLRAFHRAGRIVIEICDDGAGIDTVRVRAKAVERGLIAADAQLTEDQLRMLLFEPGFSTRDEVSDLSGRGVGMDVVKRNIQQLNGSVTLTSEQGRGSTVTIELPLTLAILEGLLVRVGDRTLVLPLLSVLETVAPSQGRIVRVAEQGEVIVVREESIPLLRLCRFLGVAGSGGGPDPCSRAWAGEEAADRRLVVVVEAGQKKVGLVIDDLLGQQQVVVKSLETHLRKIDGLMGATILADGCVAPILDVTAIAAMDLFSLHPRSAAIEPQRQSPARPVTAAVNA